VCRDALNRFGGKPLRRIFVDPEIQKSDSTAILNKATKQTRDAELASRDAASAIPLRPHSGNCVL